MFVNDNIITNLIQMIIPWNIENTIGIAIPVQIISIRV